MREISRGIDKKLYDNNNMIDGEHISNLIMTLIYNYMRPLIEHGYVYVACPPLYKVINKKERLYLKDDADLKQYRKKHEGENYIVNRFKG